MQKKKPAFILLLFLGVSLTVLSAAALDKYAYFNKLDKKYHLTTRQIAFVRPGLNLEVIGDPVVEPDGTVKVTFMVSDDAGLPLDLDGVFTPGPIRVRFLLANLPEGQEFYSSYINRTQTSPITNDSAVQPTSDSGGTFEQIAPGTYMYTYGTMLPMGYDATTTHSVGIYSDRDLEEFGLPDQIDNDVVNFVPNGDPVTKIRDVAATADCNNCHDPLAIHGGFRRDMELCVMCHYDGVIDPDTGNTVDMRVMTHKIHRGEDLPSVEMGTPYVIIGFRQSVHDYSTVVFPSDVRDCEGCHNPDNATQADAYLVRPTRAACGSCHDDVNFDTGENHAAGPANDGSCAQCHIPEGELEFDASVKGAHTIPYQSTQLAGINVAITDVTNTGPGENPTVFFTSTDNDGNPQPPSDFPFFNLIMAGPTDDYSLLVSERVVEAAQPDGDGWMYTFAEPIPADAEGTFTAGAEAFRMVTLNPGTVDAMEFRETGENPVFYFPVTDAEAVPRRMVVTDAKCESCHKNLRLHGTIRHNADGYCQMCHQPLADDSPFRPEGETPRSIDFRFMIHRIHTGEELTRDYTLTGFMGTPHNYNELLYPGDLRNCAACHVDESYMVPSAGILPIIDEYEFFSPIPPNSAACLGCHDTQDAAAHAFANIAPFGGFSESCGVCHGEDRDFSVAKIHAR